MRITDKDLDGMFVRFVTAARDAHKDIDGLVFGQHTGPAYYVGRRRGGKGPITTVSPLWGTKREAWAGLEAMALALEMEG